MKKPLILIFLILAADQILKIWIKTNFALGEEIDLIGSWCKLHFVENKGMAFGMAFGGDMGKVALTTIRILASAAIFWYILKLVKRGEKKVLIYSFSLIFCGAIGNVIDSILYGVLFSESTIFSVAQFMPANGYAPAFLGKVVDMFYFPIISTTFPEWLPFVGGNNFSFFNAIFNVADASITIGVVLLIVYYLFIHKDKEAEAEADTLQSVEQNDDSQKPNE
ncbi:MAG: lipoprotein signal peptidase [Bacteroidales bacterium]|jgi:signal peptidase II|nr:lipoprotein signal peptidase [Bacteroidales bacterium]